MIRKSFILSLMILIITFLACNSEYDEQEELAYGARIDHRDNYQHTIKFLDSLDFNAKKNSFKTRTDFQININGFSDIDWYQYPVFYNDTLKTMMLIAANQTEERFNKTIVALESKYGPGFRTDVNKYFYYSGTLEICASFDESYGQKEINLKFNDLFKEKSADYKNKKLDSNGNYYSIEYYNKKFSAK